MVMYHGSNMEIGFIDLSKCRLRTDFGMGFYLADKIETAQNWAVRRSVLVGGVPTILRYMIDDALFFLPGLRFESMPSTDWLRFICTNRQRNSASGYAGEPRHTHNWVSGPIANDKIADVVDEFIAGEVSEDEAVSRARTLPFTYQLSLHTPAAIGFVDESSVSCRQLINGRWSRSWRVSKLETV